MKKCRKYSFLIVIIFFITNIMNVFGTKIVQAYEDIALNSPTNITKENAKKWAQSKNASAEFVQLADYYWNNSPTHGKINPAIAFVQSAIETGWGHFGGVINATYKNPCGLKNSAGGEDGDPNAHHRFATWEQGVQAHLDHLALYYGAEGYPKKSGETYDPRHQGWLYKRAQTVKNMALSWANDPKYGDKILKLYNELEDYNNRNYNAGISSFIKNCFTSILGREVDSNGFTFYYNKMINGTFTAADVLKDIYSSSEYFNRKTTNEQFVESLFRSALGRISNKDGKDFWLNRINQVGFSRIDILGEFIDGTEFKNYCSKLGIKAGSIEYGKPQIKLYVNNLFECILNRKPDTYGFNFYYERLANGTFTTAYALKDIYTSNEYLNRKTTNEQFVESLFRSALGRISNKDGKDFWLNRINQVGFSRLDILGEFIDGTEYKNYCSKLGIKAGSIEYGKPQIKLYVNNLFESILNRKPDTYGFKFYYERLANGTFTAADVLKDIYSSSEYVTRKTTNEQYVESLFKSALGRTSNKDGKDYWLNELKNDTRDRVIARFIDCNEFVNYCNRVGVKPGKINSSRLIVIDPGHLGHDSGATAFGETEANLNASVAIKLEKELQSRGYKTYMTRSPLHPSQYSYLSTRDELKQRYTVANDLKADLFISLHHDSGSSTSSGIWSFYSSWKPGIKNNKADLINLNKAQWEHWYDNTNGSYADTKPTKESQISREFAQKVLNNLMNLASKSGYPSVNPRYAADRNLSVTVNTNMPSILVELGMMSNKTVLEHSKSTSGQQQKAKVIADAVKSMF